MIRAESHASFFGFSRDFSFMKRARLERVEIDVFVTAWHVTVAFLNMERKELRFVNTTKHGGTIGISHLRPDKLVRPIVIPTDHNSTHLTILEGSLVKITATARLINLALYFLYVFQCY